MQYKILKGFKGSQDGRFTEEFAEGDTVELSPYLVSAVDPNWIKAASAPVIDNKAIVTDGKKPKVK